MHIKCILGIHDWSKNCEKCEICAKERNGAHDWSANCQRCRKCSSSRRDVAHEWSGVKCAKCGCAKSDLMAEAVLTASLDAICNLMLAASTESLKSFGQAKMAPLSEAQKRKATENALRVEIAKVSTDYGVSIDELMPKAWAAYNKEVETICSGNK